eukprot:8706267-Alexandrium_andersonii.AAC.1
MSASLVGSEMCIRDSFATYNLDEFDREDSCVLPLEGGEGEAGADGPGAVSYTHLTLPTICSV